MDPNKRARLIKRRQELQIRVRQDDRKSLLSHETAFLEAKGLPYAFEFERAGLSWISKYIPGLTNGQGLDWSHVDNVVQFNYEREAELEGYLRTHFLPFLPQDLEVMLLDDNGHAPGLYMSVHAFSQNIPLFLNGSLRWLLGAGESFILEHDTFKELVRWTVLDGLGSARNR